MGVRGPNWFLGALSPDLQQSVIEVAEQMAEDAIEDLTPESAPVLIYLRSLRGPRFLVAAVRQHAACRLGLLMYQGHTVGDGVYSAVLALARAREVEPADPAARARLVAELKSLPARSLETVLYVALAGRRLLLEALGWEHAGGLVEALVGLAGLERDQSSFISTDVRNSPDPTEGVADVAAVDAPRRRGEDLARRILGGYRKAKSGPTTRPICCKRGRLEQGRRGSLPLEAQPAQHQGLRAAPARPNTPLGRRTGALPAQGVRPEARRFGAQRQANHLAAVQAGLTNLAQRAGYADAVRLEWAMEARIGEDVAPVGRTWTLGAYEAELRLAPDTGAPELEVRREGKALKAVRPRCAGPTVRGPIQETLTQLRAQSGRIKETLEQCMAQGQTLSPADLQGLLRLPRTVAAGAPDPAHRRWGAPAPGARGRSPCGGRAPGSSLPPLPGRPAQRLATAGGAARLVQPFKQAFRELYLLTPVERETGTYSTRFFGHALDPRVASPPQSRGWQVESGDGALPFKVLPSAGLDAVFLFPDAGHYLAETETITSDRIYFLPRERNVPWHFWRDGTAIPWRTYRPWRSRR